MCKGNTCDRCVLPLGESTSRCALLHCNLPFRGSELMVLCPFALQLLTRLLCHAQFSTAAVHAAEEQQEAASKEAKRQELFPSLSSSSTPTRPAQSTGESSPISHSQSVMNLPGCCLLCTSLTLLT